MHHAWSLGASTCYCPVFRQCMSTRRGVHLARPDWAQMSEKSTPRRSSEAKAAISAHHAPPQLLAGMPLCSQSVTMLLLLLATLSSCVLRPSSSLDASSTPRRYGWSCTT